MDDERRVRQDLDNKLKLENRLAEDLPRVFKSIRDYIKSQLQVKQTGFDSFRWQYAFYQVYLNHYERVAKIFSHNMERQFDLRVTEDERALIDNSLALFFVTLAQTSAETAANTTLKNVNDSVIVARAQQRESLEAGEVFTLAAFASVVDNRMREKFKGRTHAIKVSETQKAAEASKITEAQVLDVGMTNINNPNMFISSTNLKDWHGILDDKIRDTHLEADSTQKNVPMNDFYIVGGFRMMYPADTSHGAPLRETMNCRCCSLYKLGSRQLSERQK